MGQGYQDRDYEIIDYELWHLEGIPRPLRGPKPETLPENKHIVCVGAAQTFGCYTPYPFPALLSKRLGVPVLNMGVAGAGPAFFTNRDNFIKVINKGSLAIVQIMSGRSESNSLFHSAGGEMLTRRDDGKVLGAAPAYQQILDNYDKDSIDSLIEENRHNWIKNYRDLLTQITAPKILLWFSERDTSYQKNYTNVHAFFGKFPQLVNDEWMNEITAYADDYVVCISGRGMPQQLYNRFTGEKSSIKKRKDLGGKEKVMNDYYPTPEMHEDAAALLEPSCKSILSSTITY